MNLRRLCLAALVLAPWLALTGVVVIAHELLTRHRLARKFARAAPALTAGVAW
jgi:hypothetical protein